MNASYACSRALCLCVHFLQYAGSSMAPPSIAETLINNTGVAATYRFANFTFGIAEDKKYNYEYAAMVIQLGYGEPPTSGLSIAIIIVVALGLGLPIALTLAGGVYVCSKRLRKQRNSGYQRI